MNLRWNSTEHCFEAEFSSDFQGDLAAVKAAGFKTTGPPTWVWFCLNTIPLTKLKENRPASGLTINPDAKVEYNRLFEIDQRNAKVKAELAAHKKELKKTKKKKETKSWVPRKPGELFDYIGPEDLPPWVPVSTQSLKKEPYTGPKCRVCDGPVEMFFYREDEPLPIACLWCQKIVLDFSDQVC